MSRAFVLVLGVWAGLSAASRAAAQEGAVLPPSPVPVAAESHGAPDTVVPGGCPTCVHAAPDGHEGEHCGGEVHRWRMGRIVQWLTYRPLPYNGCASCGSCNSCGSCGHCGIGPCCKECVPCCTPPLYAFFVHRCPCAAHVHHYPVVYKTWDGKWPRAYAGPDDSAASVYEDEERLTP